MSRKEPYLRTTKAKALFRAFFDSDEDYLAFQLKYKVVVYDDAHSGMVRVVDAHEQRKSYDGMPCAVDHNSAHWRTDTGVSVNLQLKTQHRNPSLVLESKHATPAEMIAIAAAVAKLAIKE